MATITRDELYEMVWTTPLYQLARRFGLSDVGLAKICKRLDVPRPTRGHWLRATRDRATSRPALFPVARGCANYFFVDDLPQTPQTSAPRPKPTISVDARLLNPHPVIRQLSAALKRDFRSKDMLVVRCAGQATLRVSEAHQDRALRILDAFCRWLSSEGYAIALTASSMDSRQRMLVVGTGDRAFRISLMEHQKQSDHVPTEDERAQLARHSWASVPKVDYAASGRLTLEFLHDHDWYASYGRWKDGKTALEKKLRDAALRVPEAFNEIEVEQTRRAEEARVRQLAARERAREEELVEHQAALADDLIEMSDRWQKAVRIRDFVSAVEPAILAIGTGNSAGRRSWIDWARAYADSIDPVRSPATIAKVLTPNDA